ncbi:MAG: hydrogenase maturation protease [Polyangiaceae bacterium]
MTTRVIAIGQPFAGDDGVAFAVLDALGPPPPGVELLRVRDASALIPLLEDADRVVVVDAVVGGAPGDVHLLGLDDLEASGMTDLSSHGLGVVAALRLARRLGANAELRFVAVSIEPPTTLGEHLSDEARAAVPTAAKTIVDLLASPTGLPRPMGVVGSGVTGGVTPQGADP